MISLSAIWAVAKRKLHDFVWPPDVWCPYCTHDSGHLVRRETCEHAQHRRPQ